VQHNEIIVSEYKRGLMGLFYTDDTLLPKIKIRKAQLEQELKKELQIDRVLKIYNFKFFNDNLNVLVK